MMTPLARQIAARAKAKSISIATLGKEPALKYAIRNILTGKSRKPNAEVLQAIAVILNCTIEELLTDQELFKENTPSQPKEDIRNRDFQNPKLFLEVVNLVNAKVAQHKKAPTIQQVLTSIEEIYLYSMEKNPEKVDQDFADWFIGLMEE